MMEDILYIEQRAFTQGYNAGYSQGQADATNAELTRANARIEELTSQNLELVRKYDDLYRNKAGINK